MLFNELKQILEKFIFDTALFKTSSTKDGRLVSAESEDQISTFLIEQLSMNQDIKIIPHTNNRDWYDILIIYKGIKFPINIKITEGRTADNLSSKLGMFYSLTGLWPNDVTGLNTWNSYIEKLINNFNPNAQTDYYFLVCFKNDGKFLFNSLKNIEKLTSNGNNLPFQCKWNDNLVLTKRPLADQSYYILDTFIESYKKRTPGLATLLEWRETI